MTKYDGPAGQRLVVNPLLGEAVVQTPGRMQRREGAAQCPFCADIAAGRWPAGQPTWARPNDFPALRPPLGECLVLLYARDHDRRFADLAVEEVVGIISLWRAVYADLGARYGCVMTFENSGAAIGQTQSHPHGQAYGIAALPPTIAHEQANFAAALAATGECLGCALVRAEAGGPRVAIDLPDWLGFVPAWARYPYEVQLFARRHAGTITATAPDADRDLARALLGITRAWDALFAAPMPYMLALHQLDDPAYHFHLELLPVGRAPGKLKFAASSEAAFGLWLNDAVPEATAAELRAAIVLP